jgi:hypothetical protein
MEAHDILELIHPASVRAVCYQLFNRKLLTSMAKNETNRVSAQLRDAREAGFIPWDWIVDETREAECVNAWENCGAYLETVKRAYRRDRWTDQPAYLEVWSEKGTVRGTLAPVLNEFGLTFRVMHGYASATTAHDVAAQSAAIGKPWIALYVGDWDPSGLHMSSVDLPERLARYGGEIDITRVALTYSQTHIGELPSFDATDKRHDPRYRWFVETYGKRCWELDAMNPNDLRNVVRSAIVQYVDAAAWTRADVAERAEHESIRQVVNAWQRANAG